MSDDGPTEYEIACYWRDHIQQPQQRVTDEIMKVEDVMMKSGLAGSLIAYGYQMIHAIHLKHDPPPHMTLSQLVDMLTEKIKQRAERLVRNQRMLDNMARGIKK